MPKAAKKKTLTLEKKFEKALVSKEKWPYRIPDNWSYIKLPSSFDNVTSSNKKVPKKSYLSEGIYAVIDQGKESIGGYINDKSLLYSGKLPVVIFGDHTRCIKYIDFSFVQGADGVKVLLPKAFFNAKCFYYILQNVDIPILGYRRHFPIFHTLTIPLPPLAEQQRIVDRIESLFAKLDEAKEKAQTALNSFETRKAAILHKAFTGELTAKWREENGVSLESWEVVYLQNVCEINPKKIDTNNLLDDTEVSFIPMSCVSDELGTVINFQTKYLSKVKKGYTNFIENDIIFAKITPCMENGKSAIIGKLTNNIGFGSTEFHVLRCGSKLYNRFLYYIVRSQKFRDEAKAVMAGAVGQQRVPKDFIEKYSIILPPISEQTEIVRLLDNFFAKEQRAKELCSVLDKIDLIKKSILARAFRGKLGTNDPNDENAVELLKQCLQQDKA